MGELWQIGAQSGCLLQNLRGAVAGNAHGGAAGHGNAGLNRRRGNGGPSGTAGGQSDQADKGKARHGYPDNPVRATPRPPEMRGVGVMPPGPTCRPAPNRRSVQAVTRTRVTKTAFMGLVCARPIFLSSGQSASAPDPAQFRRRTCANESSSGHPRPNRLRE